jgi:hypothetical protein
MCRTRFWNSLNQVCPKPNNLKVLGSKRTTGPKQNTQNRLRSPTCMCCNRLRSPTCMCYNRLRSPTCMCYNRLRSPTCMCYNRLRSPTCMCYNRMKNNKYLLKRWKIQTKNYRNGFVTGTSIKTIRHVVVFWQ